MTAKLKINLEVSPETWSIYHQWRVKQGEPFASRRIESILRRALVTDMAGGALSTIKQAGKTALFSFLENTVNNARKETLKQLPRKDKKKA